MIGSIFEEEDSLKRYILSIKRFSWVVLVSFLILTLAGVVSTKITTQAYQASAILIVNTGGPGNSFLPTVSSADGIAQATNYASEISSREVMGYVYQSDPQIKARGFAPDDLLADITTAISPAAASITLTASATNASDAVLLVNDVAKGFRAYTQAQLQKQLDQQRSALQNQYNTFQKQSQDLEKQILSINNSADPRVSAWTTDRADIIHNMDSVQTQLLQLPTTVESSLSVIQLAKPSDATTSSKGPLYIVAASFFGLLIGLGIMLILIFLEDRLRSEEQVKEKLGLAYLGGVIEDGEIKKSLQQVRGLVMQQFIDISANLHLTDVLPGQWRAPKGVVLLVTSAQEADGKSTVAVILSGILARAGHSVVVVDGNLRKPTTHLALGMNPAGRGLSGLLKSAGGENIDGVVQRSNVSGVWLLAGGQAIDDAALLLEQKLPDILEQLRRKVDVVIVDGPALLSGAEASILADMVDGVALVVDARRDKVRQLLRVKDILCSLTQTPVGVIMNRLPKQRRNNYFVTAYSAKAPTEKRKPDYANASNGNGNGVSNGQNEVLSLLDVSPKPQMPVSPVSQMPMPPVPPNPMPPTPFGVPAAPVPTQRTAPGSSPGIVPSRADMTSSWPQRLGKDE
jgi:succinoglycan biosynthesis transport protein ExoP